MILIYVAVIVLCAILWRLGGNGYDLCRNWGVPIAIGLAKFYIAGQNPLMLLYIPALWAMIQGFSYGSTAPPHIFWVWVIGKINGKYDDAVWKYKAKHGGIKAVEICTRCTCGFFWSLPAAIFAFFSGAWIGFGIYVLFLTIMNGLIWYFIKDVRVNEPTVGACISTAIMI